MPIQPAKARRLKTRIISSCDQWTPDCWILTIIFVPYARIELDVMIQEDSTYACVELCVMPQEAEFSCQENEDQSLFRLSLLQELSCNNQGRRSDWTTLPDQLWALSWASVSLFFVHSLPPSETCFMDFLMVVWKIQCFEKTCRCWNRLDWRRCGVEGSVIQPNYALLCALRLRESCIKTALEIG